MSSRDWGEGGLDARQGLPFRLRSQSNAGYGADSGPS